MKKINDILGKNTYGQISLALLLICIISGVVLAIPYDVENPLQSIKGMLILNPYASFIRNVHFWSAQLFLVFTLIHIWDYFAKKEKIKSKKGIWLRLSIGILIIFMAMLTGFLLKADSDSLQAFRILESLTLKVPFIGNLLASSFLGEEGDFQLIYIHHIATLTIFISIITFEHSRKIWPISQTFIWSSLFIIIISYFFTAPLHDGLNLTVKGPWYFVGFQEVLHWLSSTSTALIIILIFLILIYIFPYGGRKLSFFSKRSLLILSLAYLLLTISGMFLRGENWKWIWPWDSGYSTSVLETYKSWKVDFNTSDTLSFGDSNSNNKESCILCHSDMLGFTPSHNPEAVGCFSCHGGNPYTTNKKASHKGMELIPGNFSNANRSCGTTNCHPEITNRKNSSLMSTLSGMISVDRYVFNEQDNPDKLTSVDDLRNTAADEHLKNMCVVCHLDNEKTETGPITEKSRGGGCLACHLNHDAITATASFNHKNNSKSNDYLKYHPSISMQVTNNHCFGCHSRSGRISTNYEGWHETTLSVDEMPNTPEFRLIEESRVFTAKSDDVHHKLGIDCIDCHNSYELMGDGNLYAHQEDQRVISCEDCHFDGEPNTIAAENLDAESAIIASMRFGEIIGKRYLKTKQRDIPLINTEYKNDTAYFYGKNSLKKYILTKPAEICTKGTAHDNVSCSACHSAWAPSCIGCHNEYDENEPGFDMQKNIEKNGSWVEYVGEYNAHAPALGIRKSDSSQEIIPVVPGMVLTIDMSSFNKQLHDSLIFQRLFAPASPHTTASKGRDCKSCHYNPIALGYGQGEFSLLENEIYFNSKYQNNPNDGLPEDAWINFLGEPKGKFSTRSNLVPFSIEQQKNILKVGVCLTCHEDNSDVMQKSLYDFKTILKKQNPRCIEVY
ncbi:MAG: hypothetical protein C0598_09060 [Marinilabiliales bacterium]|nr:MAG: hypothetical protein C0598_09060 [Marinilabiliales bacterium]